MKYKWAMALSVVLGAVVLNIPIALAHFPATDKTMTVTLHIDPGDQPIAGQPAVLNFIYDDQLGKFNSQKCDCKVTIYEQGKQLYSGLSEPDSSGVFGGSVPYIFGKSDVYEINLAGTPKVNGNFVPFNVSWNIRVIQDKSASPSNEKYYIIGYIGLMVIGASLIGYFIYHDFKDA